MSAPRDPEALFLEELSDDERAALVAASTPGDVDATRRIVDALSSLEADDWRNAETPALRFVPEGADTPARSWLGALRDLRVPAPALASGLAVLVLLAGAGGFALRAVTGPEGMSDAALAEAKLQTQPGISLVRGSIAPADAGGIARMMGEDVDRMMVRAHGLPAPGAGRYYEVWLRAKGADDSLVSVGRFQPEKDGSIDARFPMRVDPERYGTAIVTLQSPEDGGAYSGRSVLRSAST